MKTKILDINGQTKKIIELPKFFENEIREDIVAKVLEAKKKTAAIFSVASCRKTAFC